MLSWLIPCWGLCFPSLTVAIGLHQFVLALAVITNNNPPTFCAYPQSLSLLSPPLWWPWTCCGVMYWWGLDHSSMLRLTFCCFEFVFHWITSFTLWTVKLQEYLGQYQQRGRWGVGVRGVCWSGVVEGLYEIVASWVSAWSFSMFEAKYLVSIYQQRYMIQLSKWVRCV